LQTQVFAAMPHTPLAYTGAIASAMQHAQWAGLRHVCETTLTRVVRNDAPEANRTRIDEGVMCEVLLDGHFGYAATADTSPEGLERAFGRALQTTRATRAHGVHAFDLAQRPPVHGSFTSPRLRTLDQTSLAEVTDCLLAACKAMAVSERVVSRSASAWLVQTQTDYFSSNGTQIRQNLQLADLTLAATATQGGQSQSRSWSHTGQIGAEVFDRTRLVAQAHTTAREALALIDADNCPTGPMDLILMPDQMMLQIHESIGHPLELDRILGDERNYAGWSFVQPEDFGQLRYGSELMNVSFDPQRVGEFASYGFDDGGNPAHKAMLIANGVLLRGLGSLESQARSGLPGVANFRAASWNRAPIDRMANINLEPGASSLPEMVGQIAHGIVMHTNRSWSIDDYRNKFQFGCEYGQLIENGRLGRVVRNPNYRGVTVDFWRRLAGVGRDDAVYGTPHCGKGEPNQLIRVGHAAPPCWFRGVQVFGGQA
jgi:predicted Zn-dependent protease